MVVVKGYGFEVTMMEHIAWLGVWGVRSDFRTHRVCVVGKTTEVRESRT